MQKHSIDVLCLQETKMATSSLEKKRYEWAEESYTIYFSSNAKPKPKQTAKPKAAPGGKAKAGTQSKPKTVIWEPLGVGMVLNERAQNAVVDVEKTDSRIMHAKFECEGTSLNIINHHAPQSGTYISHKHRHWRTLEKML